MDRARQVPRIAVHPIDDQRADVIGQGDLQAARQPVENAQPRGAIGRLDAAHQPAGESRREHGAEFRQRRRRAIGGQHQLTMPPQQGVHRVLQLDQRRALAQKELHVVDQQQVHVPILVAETRQPAATQRFEEHRRELLGRQVQHVTRLPRAAHR